MRYPILTEIGHVVALGGGHGLGRVLSSLSFLGTKLTGIVATTDNGGSTGRLRQSENCIAWGDLRNCLSQLAFRPSVGSLLFEYRFDGDSELTGHNLGNLILLATDKLCVRPLEAVNLVRHLLKIDAQLIPMSEQPTHLQATASCGQVILGELNVDAMSDLPSALMLEPLVQATAEAIDAIEQAKLILLGPGSFFTSILPPLLIPAYVDSIRTSQAKVIFLDNITNESSAAGTLSLQQKLAWCQSLIGSNTIDFTISHQREVSVQGSQVYFPLESRHSPGFHDRIALADAIELCLQGE